MKRTGKILVALLAVIILLTSMSALTVSAATGQPEKLYLTPNANWKQSNARFAAYFFGNGETWVSMTDADKDGVYEVTVPTTKKYPSVIFCRMNPSATANNWNNKWNQTADLTIPTDGTNHYTVKESTWDKGGGTWSTFGSTCLHTNLGPAATCTTGQVCLDCGDPVVAALGHSFNSSHLCTTCNIQASFTVAGSGAHLGKEWDTTYTANDMTYADGVYTKVYENVAVGTYAFKVARDHDWGTAYPNTDKSYKVAVEGSTVTITLKGTVVDVKVEIPVTDCPHENRGPEATCTEPQVCLDCEEVVVPATGHPGFGSDHLCTACGDPAPFTIAGTGAHLGTEWDVANTANDMTYADGLYTKVYENVAVGSYKFKVARNHSWDVSYPGEDRSYTVSTAGSNVVITFNGSAVDVTVSAPHTCEYTEPATCLKGQHCKCGLVDPEHPELGDHVFEDGLCSVCGELDLEDTIVIYFENNWEWPTVHFFYWYGTTGNNAAWPGVDLKDPVAKSTEGHDIYKIELPVGISGFIFSGTGMNGDEQSNDVKEFAACNYYYMTYVADNNKPAAVKEHHSFVFVDCETPETCSVCGKVNAEAPGHTEVTDAAVAPTCEDTGLTEGSHCEVCNKVIVAQEVVDALGHDMIVDAAVAPTCEDTGLTEGSHCSRCDHKVAQEVVDALGHEFNTFKSVCSVCYAPNPDYIVNTIDVTKENKLICNEYHLVGDLGPYEFLTVKIENAGHYKFVGTGLAFTIYTIPADAPGADFTAGTGSSWSQFVFTEADFEPGTYWIGIVFALGEGEYTATVEYTAPHSHNFVDGKCECGEEDPNYVPPHEHEFVDGKCECGEEDPNYVAPEEPGEDKPGEDKPGDTQPEPSFFERIWTVIVNFLKSIKDFFTNLIKTKK